jgi:hypothetical protein
MPPEEPNLIACIDPEVGQVAKEPKHGGPRPGAGRPKSNSNNVAVKMDKEIVQDAKTVAVLRGVSLVEYLNTLIRSLVKRDLDKELKKKVAKGGDRP